MANGQIAELAIEALAVINIQQNSAKRVLIEAGAGSKHTADR